MKGFAIWCSHHKKTVQTAFVFSNLILAYLAYFFAQQLLIRGIQINGSILWLTAIIFIVVAIIYKRHYKPCKFFKRKLLDATVVCLAFVLMVTYFNQKTTSAFVFYPTLNGSFITKKG